MPNHVSNILIITGPEADLRQYLDMSRTAHSEFDFDGVVPMPQELRDTTSPTRIQTQEEIDACWKAHYSKGNSAENERTRPFGLGMTQADYNRLIATYGVANWYDWAIRNWGTKWGAYHVHLNSMERVIASDGDWSDGDWKATLRFDTAWSPGTEYFTAASEKFPTLRFYNEFADEGGGFVGSNTFQNGETIDCVDLEWDSEEGREMRGRLGYLYDDEDFEDLEDEEDDE